MASHRRLDLSALLGDAKQRRELMVQVIIATQAREGITTTREQAEAAFDHVCNELRTGAKRTAQKRAKSYAPKRPKAR